MFKLYLTNMAPIQRSVESVKQDLYTLSNYGVYLLIVTHPFSPLHAHGH